ncbi:MAG: preprotein translocase subunit SecG [Clostridiales bacterium]|nr:preprotein translocase subunit SecG [Clostridiales bacterium]
MASGGFWNVWPVIKIIALIIMAICALFIILVVLFQPGNSSGVGALGGQTETFLGKNKSKTFEHRMKKLTVISSIVFGVLCIAFAIVAFFAGV